MRQFDGPAPFFRFDSLPDNGHVRHAIFTRQGGVSAAPFASLNLSSAVPDNEAAVSANRRKAYAILDREEGSLVHARLIHGADVVQVTSADHGRIVGPVDGLITSEAGCALTMNFADCAPVFIYDPTHRAIGLGHAGWGGAVKDLPGALMRAMTATFGSKPGEITAAIGPCIGPCCYEVGEPVISAVQRSFDRVEGLLHPQPGGGRPHFDLPEANRRRLASAGIKNIEMAELCTACRTDLFFSHRKEQGRTGRFGVLLALEPNP